MTRMTPDSAPQLTVEPRAMRCVLFDWGNTLMVDFHEYSGPMSSWPRVEAIPHARETLTRLRASGWMIALATNAADSDEPEIRAALARVALDELVDRVYCSRGVGHAKPSPEFFAHIISDTGLPASRIVMVGDSPTNDVAGARGAGMPAVLYRPGATVCHHDGGWWVVGSLLDLPALLETTQTSAAPAEGGRMSGGIFKWAAPLFALAARRWDDDDAALFADWLRPSVPRGGSLLDLGGGTGKLGSLLSRALECSVTILDASPHMLRYTAGMPGVTGVLGDAAALPFEDASFDGVVVVDAFHHFPRQADVAREIARVLKSDGVVVVAELDPTHPGVRRVATLERWLREPATFLEPCKIADLFSAVGIEGRCHPQSRAAYAFVGVKGEPCGS